MDNCFLQCNKKFIALTNLYYLSSVCSYVLWWLRAYRISILNVIQPQIYVYKCNGGKYTEIKMQMLIFTNNEYFSFVLEFLLPIISLVNK